MLMEVSETLAVWEESWLRERRWTSLGEAVELLDSRRGLEYFAREAARRLNVPLDHRA